MVVWKPVEHDVPPDNKKAAWKKEFNEGKKKAREGSGIKGSGHKDDKWTVTHGNIENEVAAKKHVEEMEASGKRKMAGAKNKPY
jgi:hypothetical protein